MLQRYTRKPKSLPLLDFNLIYTEINQNNIPVILVFLTYHLSNHILVIFNSPLYIA